MVTQSGSNKYAPRRDHLARGRAPAPVHPDERRQQRPPPELLQPGRLGPHHQGQALVLSEHRGPQRADPAAIPIPPAWWPTPPPRYYWNTRGTLKLTWQVTPRNKIQSFTLINREAWQQQPRGLGRHQRSPADAGLAGLLHRRHLGVAAGRQPLLQVAGGAAALLPHATSPRAAGTSPRPAWTWRPTEQLFPRRVLYTQLRPGQPAARPAASSSSTRWSGSCRPSAVGEHSVKSSSRFLTRNYETTDGVPGRRLKTVFNGGAARPAASSTSRTIRAWSRGPAGLLDPRRAPATASATRSSDVMRVTRYLTVTPGLALTANQAGTNRPGCVISQTGGDPAPGRRPGTSPTTAAPSCAAATTTTSTPTPCASPSRPWATGSSRECRWNAATGAYDTACRYIGRRQRPHHRAALRTARASTPDGQALPREAEDPAHARVHAGRRAGGRARAWAWAPTSSTARSATPTSWPRPTGSGTTSGTALARGGAYRNGRAETVDRPRDARRAPSAATPASPSA